MKKKILLLILLLTITTMLTGCWDSVSIDKREFIFAVGIDKKDDMYSFTAEIPKINEGNEQQRLVYTEESENFSKLFDSSFLRSEKVISDRLMQVIVLGEGTVNDPESVKKLFDEIQRSPQMNRRVKIAITKGDAKNIIDTEIPNNPIVGRFLSAMLIKLKQESYQDVFTFDEAIIRLGQVGSAMIPLVETEEDSLKVAGAAIMKDYKVVGYLDNDEVEIIMLLLDHATSNMSNKSVEIDDRLVSLGAVNVSKTKDIQLVGDKLTANYYITLYCYIDSFTLGDKSLEDQNFLSKLKSEAEENVSEKTDELIKKMQEEYNTDIFRIKDDLYKYHKTDYEKISDKYDEVFKNADINVHYKVKIMSTGLVK